MLCFGKIVPVRSVCLIFSVTSKVNWIFGICRVFADSCCVDFVCKSEFLSHGRISASCQHCGVTGAQKQDLAVLLRLSSCKLNSWCHCRCNDRSISRHLHLIWTRSRDLGGASLEFIRYLLTRPGLTCAVACSIRRVGPQSGSGFRAGLSLWLAVYEEKVMWGNRCRAHVGPELPSSM